MQECVLALDRLQPVLCKEHPYTPVWVLLRRSGFAAIGCRAAECCKLLRGSPQSWLNPTVYNVLGLFIPFLILQMLHVLWKH